MLLVFSPRRSRQACRAARRPGSRLESRLVLLALIRRVVHPVSRLESHRQSPALSRRGSRLESRLEVRAVHLVFSLHVNLARSRVHSRRVFLLASHQWRPAARPVVSPLLPRAQFQPVNHREGRAVSRLENHLAFLAAIPVLNHLHRPAHCRAVNPATSPLENPLVLLALIRRVVHPVSRLVSHRQSPAACPVLWPRW